MTRFWTLGILACGAAGFGPIAVAAPLTAQDTSMDASVAADREAVLETVHRLFDGMRANDEALVLSAFHPDATLISTERGRTGEPATRVLPAAGFAAAVGAADAPWDEPVWDPVVHIQDHLATVWINYAFYMGGTEFSHCGVDAFILARGDEGWKIVSLADSRQFEDCDIPENVRR